MIITNSELRIPNYQIRPARPEDVRPALDLALRVFMAFEAPFYGPEAVGNFKHDVTENEAFISACEKGGQLMHVAACGGEIVGTVAVKNRNHVCILFIDPAWHRKGIATALMDAAIAAMGADEVTVNSSPYGLPFYLRYGFVPTDTEQRLNGFVFTPMVFGRLRRS